MKLRKRFRVMKRAMHMELREHKSSFIVYVILRVLVILTMILQIFNRNYENVFLCILTLFLLLIPSFIQINLKIELPTPLEITILVFIFAAEILGEIQAYYIYFPFWDTVLHTINGFLMAAIGFSLVDILNRSKKTEFQLSPAYLAVVAFCFSMTIGVIWEFFEFGMDCFFGLDMQKDTIVNSIHSVMLDPQGGNVPTGIENIRDVTVNGMSLGLGGYLDIGLIDTMKDLLVNFAGASVFSVIGYFYVKNRGKGKVAKGLIPRLKTKDADFLKQAGKEEETKAHVKGSVGGERRNMFYIGIDLGTSAVKLLLMDEAGRIHKVVSREYPLYFPQPGWSEQNPEDWYVQTAAGIHELVADVDKSQVAGISFGGQMHGLVVLDEKDRVIRPAILWNDGRTVKQTDYLNQVIGKEKLSEYTANIAFAGFTAPKLLWMREEEPDNFAKIAKIMLPKDYLAYRLSGVHCTDYSDASGTLLLDVEHKRWSKPMMDICGVTEAQLPKLYESFEVVGTLRPEAAKELGLPSCVKIIAGAGDNAAAIGTGTVGDGRCNISLGTSGTIFISSKSFGVDANNALHSFAHADGQYHLMGCMLSAASCNKWWNQDILGTKDFAAEQAGIERLGENQVFYLPYLMGERSPHNDPGARGMFIGMTMDTTREDMTQAVLEGVAFGLRDSLEVARSIGIHIERTKICGGGAKSLLWKKIIANVMNLKVDVIETEEGPGYGGAVLAAVGCGAFSSVEEAAEKLVKVTGTIEPEAELAAKYEEKYQKFRKIYPTVKELFQEL